MSVTIRDNDNLSELINDLEKNVERIREEIADIIHVKVAGRFLKGEIGGPALSVITLAGKVPEIRPLIETHQMMDAVNIWETSSDTSHIGIQAGGIGRVGRGFNNVTNEVLGWVHEEGTARIPARPWLGPAVDENLNEILNELEEKIYDMIGDYEV